MRKNLYLTEPLRIMSIKDETVIDRTFRLEYAEKLVPGQFLELSVPGFGEAPISVSDFGEGYLDMTIRNVGCLTKKLFELGVGDEIFVRGPYGNGFKLEDYEGKDLLIVAGGTGLAPVKRVVGHFAENPGLVKSLTLIAGFKSPDDILFKEDLEKWSKQAKVILTVDNPREDWNGNTGLVTKHIDELPLKDAQHYSTIVVGPPIMMKFAVLSLMRRGIQEENIWVSFERRMNCGVGKCGHCKIDDTYVCVDGPVFNFVKAKKLID